MSWRLLDLARKHKTGAPVGVTAVCSAHPLVLRAAIAQAVADDDVALIEATSNQVDQFGGYTGLRPTNFRDLVHRIAAQEGLPADRLILGGDHLGPNRWQYEPAAQAMAKALDLVAAYVAAGYQKIHLDCSMPCADDPRPLPDAVVAERAARMLAVAEQAARQAGTHPVYVIGSEVPVPGGAHEDLGELRATTPEAAQATLAAHRTAFTAHGVAHAWDRVIGLVVQPGVEFDHLRVVQYERPKTRALRRVLDDEPVMLFEEHSTDYQLPERLAALVEDHWFVLKVGPGLTFNLREGLFALAHIEDELVPARQRSGLRDVLEAAMIADPTRWASYYPGDGDAQRIARRYSYSDRLRYYLPDADVAAAQERLLRNLTGIDIPPPLIDQYLPTQYERVLRGHLPAHPHALVMDRVRDALRPYSAACHPGSTPR
jgi:D-tagatose-1,6-bisphosphate aldolase subunit GatZ/KbaZ